MGSAAIAEGMVRDSFLKWLRKQEEDIRFQNYRDFADYYDGEHLNVLPPRIKKAIDSPFMCILNYCRPVVDIVVDYLCGNPVNLDVTEYERKTDVALRGEALLNYVYKQNGLFGSEMIKLVRVMAKKGDVFLKLHLIPDEDGNPVDIGIDVIRPDVVYPKYADDNYKYMEACGIKWFNLTGDGNRQWYARVFYPDVVQTYDLGETAAEDLKTVQVDEEDNIIRSQRTYDVTSQSADWQLIEEAENPFGLIPIFHIRNGTDDLPYGVSDLHVMTYLQDALNKAMTDLCVVMDNQAFQRVFLFGAYSKDELDMGPGVVTKIPNEAGRLQVLSPVSIADYLYSIDTIVDQISAVTYTPRQVFGGYHDVPTSGYALNIRFMQLDNKCRGKQENIRTVLQQLNKLIMREAVRIGLAEQFGIGSKKSEEFDVTDAERALALETEVRFVSGLPKDELMMTQVLMYQLQMGLISRQTAMEKIGVPNVEEEFAKIMAEYAAMPQEEEKESGEE